jgi:ribonuclease P protein component
VHGAHFLLLLIPQHEGAARVGVTVSSKVGNAVERNRVKRWIREFVRRHKGDLPTGEMVLVAKSSAAGAEHAAVDRDLEQTLARARRSA